jgi:hypothetical protein
LERRADTCAGVAKGSDRDFRKTSVPDSYALIINVVDILELAQFGLAYSAPTPSQPS